MVELVLEDYSTSRQNGKNAKEYRKRDITLLKKILPSKLYMPACYIAHLKCPNSN